MSLGDRCRPLVSVVVRCYQAEPTLLRAVTSVLTQTLPDLECLVVDDGSSDRTMSLVAQIRDARVRFVRLPVNLGRAAALKVGVTLSRGSFIGLLDADDWLYPSKLERQLDALERAPDLAFVTTNMALMKPDASLCAIEGVRNASTDLVRFAPMSRPGQRRLPHAPSLFRAPVLRQAPIDLGLARCSDLYLVQTLMLQSPCAILTSPLYAYAYPQQVHVYEDCAAASRHVYRKFLRRYPVSSLCLQAVSAAKQLTYGVSAVSGTFTALLRARGMEPRAAEVEEFMAAKAALDRALREQERQQLATSPLSADSARTDPV